ncbi:MAG: site-specific DNA-methyltransferase [Parabacteroides sp.]|nr:site-specific DNA-methyltransferase [Parabacteroides sp.]
MQRLELTWIGKGQEPAVEPRILLHDPSKDYGDPDSPNMLIHGDNLLALKALEQQYAGKVKCIYIDPPYNTGSAFEHYDDNLEHSIWLSLMKPRLSLLKKLLTEDGFIFVQIDDNEQAYLKVLMDEIFGRACYVNTIVWKRRGGSANPSNKLNNVTDYILWYANTPNTNIYPVFSKDDDNTKKYIEERFRFVDENGRRYMKSPIQSPNPRPNLMYEYKGYRVPTKGWSISREVMEKWDAEGRLAFPDDKKKTINRKIFLDEYQGQPISSLWTDIFVINPMSSERVDFDGQKPEALIQRILLLSTKPGDLVLDSFLGSGTTAATAHKMGRRWIGVELGNHAYTHCKTRLDKVVSGEDQSGISESVNWQGGGGYKFYELAPTLIVNDRFGNKVFSDKYNPQMLVAAVTKVNGYSYSPNPDIFWKQGYSQDNSFIYITTQYLTAAMLDSLAKEVGALERLLICAPAFDVGLNKRYDNITVKKIPQSILDKCEYGVDNYNLNIQEVPECNEEEWDND